MLRYFTVLALAVVSPQLWANEVPQEITAAVLATTATTTVEPMAGFVSGTPVVVSGSGVVSPTVEITVTAPPPSVSNSTIERIEPLAGATAEEFAVEPVEPNGAEAQPLVIPVREGEIVADANAPRSIEESVRIAENHPLLAVRGARIDEARGEVRSAVGAKWFSLTGDATMGGETYREEDFDHNGAVANGGLTFLQPLIDGGRRSSVLDSAEKRLGAAEQNLAWQQRLRRYAAAEAHIQLWLAQELARVNDENLAALEEIATSVGARLKAGEATVTELAEAQSRAAAARAVLAEKKSAFEVAQNTYLREVGDKVFGVIEPGAGPQVLVSGEEDHPLIEASKKGLAAAGAVVEQREAGYWPTLDMRARAAHDRAAGASREEDATSGLLTLNLGYTFIDNGVTAGEVAAAKGARKAAEAELNDTFLQIKSERGAAEGRMSFSRQTLEESEVALEESRRVVANLQREVLLGNRPLRDLLDARRDELAAESSRLQAYAARALAAYNAEKWR